MRILQHRPPPHCALWGEEATEEQASKEAAEEQARKGATEEQARKEAAEEQASKEAVEEQARKEAVEAVADQQLERMEFDTTILEHMEDAEEAKEGRAAKGEEEAKEAKEELCVVPELQSRHDRGSSASDLPSTSMGGSASKTQCTGKREKREKREKCTENRGIPHRTNKQNPAGRGSQGELPLSFTRAADLEAAVELVMTLARCY
jgi:hypothetical protein